MIAKPLIFLGGASLIVSSCAKNNKLAINQKLTSCLTGIV